MIYEWDQAKSERNAHARGLPFEIAMALLEGPTLEEPDLRKDYGEHRIRALGQVNDVVMVCIYTDRSLGRAANHQLASGQEERTRCLPCGVPVLRWIYPKRIGRE
jgi:uncharacterized DUF497 family protein